MPRLARAIEETGWSVVEVLLTSSYAGWGHSSIAQDAKELALAVQYFREHRNTRRVVLLGHSTGKFLATFVRSTDYS